MATDRNPSTPASAAAPTRLRAPGALAAAFKLLHPLGFVLFMAMAVAAVLAGGLVWVLRSEQGSHWLLPRLPGVEASGLEGAPLGDRFAAERLAVRWAGGQSGVTLTGLRAEELRWHWRPAAGVWVALEAGRLEATRVEVRTGPASAAPPVPPRSLALPLSVTVPVVRVAQWQIDAAPLVRDLSAAIVIGGDAGRVHRIDRLAFSLDHSRIEASGQIATALPFGLTVQAQAQPLAGSAHDWQAQVRAQGPLMEFALEASLAGRAARGRAAQGLQARASIEPFARWPIASLEATTEGLDLAALFSAAPRTSLRGRVDVRGRALDQPLGALVQLDNRVPGRWDEGRLPLARLELDVEGELAQRDRLDLRRFELALAGAVGQPAGLWTGKGRWEGHQLEVDSTLADVQPERLDVRASPMRIGGPLAFTVTGLPSPQGQGSPTAWAVQWRSSLQGRLASWPQPVALASEGRAAAARLQVSTLRAQIGGAEALGSLELARAGDGGWQLASEGSLRDFDPLPWWPGEPGSAWREGPHRLNAGWKLALRVPAALERLPWAARLQRLQGQGTLTLRESVLAGVPVAGRIVLENVPGERSPSRLQGELALGANRLEIDGRADPAGEGTDDRLRLELQAPRLAALAPLARLLPEGTGWQPRDGRATVSLQLGGRWPAMRTQGEAALEDLQTGALQVASAKAEWVLDTAAERPLSLRLQGDGLVAGSQRADEVRIDLSGTLREHRIDLDARVPAAPPEALAQWLGLRSAEGTRVRLQGEGTWRPQGAGGLWRGRMDRLQVLADGPAVTAHGAGPGARAALAAPSGRPAVQATSASAARGPDERNAARAPEAAGGEWLDARDLQAEVRIDDTGRLERIEAAAGRARVARLTDLRWERVRVDFGDARPRLELRAEVEPFAVAPLQARLQPAMGWGGTLRLGARLDLRAAERFDAEVVVERLGGDLQIGGGNGAQPLGLDELRATLSAHDGVWSLVPRLRGRTLGEITGALRARTTPESRWPGLQAPLDGRVQAHVADLGIWSVWIPAGWRLGGEVRTTAELGGRLGAPEFTGELRGSGLGARNLLLGVNVGQGEVAVALQGAKARIERFTLRGGEGQLSVAGDADFGERPEARLRLQAERFRVLGRVDRQLTAGGQAELTLRARDIRLTGALKVDEGLFDLSRRDAPALDEDVRVRRAGEVEDPSPGPVTPALQALQMNLDVDLGQALRVRGRGLDTLLTGRLNLSTPGGRLSVTGAVNAPGGQYAAYGQKLDIERGVVAFNGPLDNPRLDILALRANTDVRVGVAIGGTLTLPRVRLYADPEMSEAEKLSWLLLGRPPDGLGRSDTAMLQRAVVALLAGEGEAPTDTLMRNLGLDEFSLRAGEERETVVSLGKQLSRRWWVGYERSVNATAGTWQLIYRIAQRFTLRAQSGEDSSLDLIWTWRRDEPEQRGVPRSVSLPP